MLLPSKEPVSDTVTADHPVDEQPAMVCETEESLSLVDKCIETHANLSKPLSVEHNLVTNQVGDVNKFDTLVDQDSNAGISKDAEPARRAKTKGQLKKQLRRKRMQSANVLMSSNCMNGKTEVSDSESALPSSQSSAICPMDIFQSKVSTLPLPDVELVI